EPLNSELDGVGLCFGFFSRLRCGHFHHEARPAIFTVVATDLATVFLHDSVAHAQAQASTLSNRTSRVERIKDSGGFFDSGAIVSKLHSHRAVDRRALNGYRAPMFFCYGMRCVADDLNEYFQ